MKTKHLLPFLILLSTLLISACATASAQELNDPTALPPVQDFAVIAEGRLVPNQSVQLGFVSGGQVAEILVAEGDHGGHAAQLGERGQVDRDQVDAVEQVLAERPLGHRAAQVAVRREDRIRIVSMPAEERE